MKHIKCNRVCNVCNVYALLLYLLASTKQEIDETFFIFNASGVPLSIRTKFKSSYTMPNYNNWGILGRVFIQVFGFIVFRYIRYSKLPSLKDVYIYATDFSRYDSIIIGSQKYTNIEDCPNGYIQTYENHFKHIELKKKKNRVRRWIVYLLYGELYYNRFGNNSQCIGFLAASSYDLSYQKNKLLNIVPFKEAWRSANEEKKSYILNAFNVTIKDIEMIKTREIIILTQPLWPDYISKESHYRIYKEILSNYDSSKVIIKTHPRDKFCYKDLDQNIIVFDKPIPFQLMSITGWRCKRVATVFSTAIQSLDEHTIIDWYGTRIDAQLYSILGDIACPVKI